MVNNRRSEIEIIGKILDLSKEGAKKTELLYHGNLSYLQLNSYLTFLVNKEVLAELTMEKKGNNGKFYKLTSKGNNLLQDINKTLAYFR